MGEYKQAGRKMRVTVDGLGPDDLLLKAFVGTETIARLFSYELEMIAENKQKISFDQVLGKKATIHLQLPDESSETHINGLVVEFGQGDRDDTFTTYRLEMVPEAWRLTRKTQSKIFQRKTVPEILKATLKGFPVQWKLEASYEPRDYCSQYRESDFDFASRLMEEEGIWYYFSHSDGSHEMVVGDSPGGFVDVKGETSFVYEELEGGMRDDNRVWAWEKVQRMRAGKVLLWDHCFELPHRHLDAEQQTIGSVTAGKDTHKLTLPGVSEMELYDWPGAYAQRFDGINKGGGEQPAELQKIFTDNRRTVEIRMDEETATAVEIRGKSNVKHLVPGHKFTLKRHFAGGDGPYLLVSVQHAGEFGGDYRSGKSPLTYRNSFTCMPVALRFRPACTTPEPTVKGTQTAVVVGPAGEEIFTDKYGRVKVQFHWDRDEPKNEESSCWVRVATHWAGQQWGAIHIPRIGQEVVVDFLEGDPDQPIIVGSVYNAGMMPPYDLPANKTRSGIKSRSSKGGGPPNFNEIMFEDKKGQELLKIHAEKNQDIEVENDESHTVGNDRNKSINRDETVAVGRDRTESVGRNETISVGTNRTETVGANESITIGGSETIAIGKSLSLSVAKGVDVTIGTDSNVNVGGNSSVQIGKSGTITASKTITLTAGDQVQIQAGDAGIVMKKDGSITIKGKNIDLIASGKINIKASSNVTIKGSKISQN